MRLTHNWRAKPLTSRTALVELIATTTTKAGLKVACALDTKIYEKAIKVSDDEMAALDIRGDEFQPAWNYTVHPRSGNLAVIFAGILWGNFHPKNRTVIPEWSSLAAEVIGDPRRSGALAPVDGEHVVHEQARRAARRSP